MATLRLVPTTGAPLEITEDRTTVGRDPACGVAISDGSVSRRHANLERRETAWYVVDLGSANGTTLDSQRITESILREGQELRFGAVSYRVEILADEDGTILTAAPPNTRPLPMPAPAPIRVPPLYGTAPPVPPARQVAAPPPPPPLPGRPAGPPRPPGAVGHPPMGGGEAPPAKKGKGPFFWIGAGCCGCLAFAGAAVAVVVGLGLYATQGVVKPVRSQIAEIKAGNIDAAYARLTGDLQSKVPKAAFEAFVNSHPGLKENADSTFTQRSIDNNTGRLIGVLTSTSKTTTPVRYQLLKEGGVWKISVMNVGGENLEEAAAQAQLQIETSSVRKTARGSTTEVVIKILVSGFAVRPSGGAFSKDLVEDVETFAPSGEKVEGLSRVGVLRDQGQTTLAKGAAADFTTTLTLGASEPPGTYTVRLTVHDLVSSQNKSHDLTFERP